MKCGRAGCDGTIGDGYCDVCGLAPAPAPDPETETIHRAAAPRQSGERAPSSAAPDRSPTPARVAAASSTSSTTPQRRLGGGLVVVSPVELVDPTAAVLPNPQVAEHHRYCRSPGCGEAVGRSRDGQPGLTTGFCRRCRTPYSFEPKLHPGDLVAGQYEVIGCLAHGGLGWVYLARDRKVGFYVALKGLLDPDDEDGRRAATAERQFLAEITHPNIVKIHNYVEHDGDSYIVMEYISGESLKQMLAKRAQANGGASTPLPVAEAIVYCLEVLPAFEHLHHLGFLYCDFKPENLIRTEHSVKLIDLGGAFRMGDTTSEVWGTRGFKAPELSATGPTIETDLYTVGRTLAVLCTDFAAYQAEHEFSLPPRDTVPEYVRFECLLRFLERATAAEPGERFHSAAEMADQLEGVLHQVVARDAVGGGRERRPRTSAQFTPQSRGPNDRPDVRRLPSPLFDPEDPQAGLIMTMAAAAPADALRSLAAVTDPTIELRRWKARKLIELGDLAAAVQELDAIASGPTYDWRDDWFRGVVALVEDEPDDALRHFECVHRWLPGELAPALASAFACERAGDIIAAGDWYATVSDTDSSFTSAAFGLARCRRALDDVDGALRALRRVPEASSSFTEARVAEVELLLLEPSTPLDRTLQAAAIVESLSLDPEQEGRLRAQVLETALLHVTDAMPATTDATVFGTPLAERDLRAELETTYRSLARRAATTSERVRLVDRANHLRPRTLL